MNKHAIALALFVSTLILLETCPLVAQRPKPVMDFTSILDTLDVTSTDGTLQFNQKSDLYAAFLPKNSVVDVVIRKIGEPVELHSTNLGTEEHYGKFSTARAIGSLKEKVLTIPGDYLVTYRCNGVPISRLRVTLSVDNKASGKSYRLDGPWERWVQLRTALANKSQETPQIVCWLKNESGNEGEAEKYSIQVRKEDELVYEAQDASVTSAYWKPYILNLRFPLNIGGNLVTPIEFFNRNGDFTIQIRKGNRLVGVYPFQVLEGILQYHQRQKTDHRPTHEYMITRFAGKNEDGSDATNVFWLEKTSNENANAIAAAENLGGSNSFITSARRASWKFESSADPNRKFKLVETQFEADDKAHLAVGDDLIVFGTGYPRGIAYINVGDEEVSNLPESESIDSRLFWVCGKKIVLFKHKSMAIYDTVNGRLTPIDVNEVLLYEISGGLYHSNMIHADGNLVAVVNDLTLVKDQRTIKVVDLGSEKPSVIALRNGNFIAPEISGIAIDVQQEIVVVASWQRKKIYFAKVQPDAKFVEVSLSDYNGIGRKQFQIVDGGLLYADVDDKLMYLKLDGQSTPRAISSGPVGIGGAGFDCNGRRIVMATKKQSGTRFEIAVSNFPETPQLLTGTGKPIPGTTGEFGMAGHACVANDGTIFLSGTPGGGIGIGEFLQVLMPVDGNADDAWQPIVDSKGNPIQAIDVVAGTRILAFKTGSYNAKTKIGYATFGDKIDPSMVPMTDNPLTASNDVPDGNPVEQLSEEEHLLIKNYQKVEKELYKSFAAAIGDKSGAKQARKAILDVIKKKGHEHLINAYIELAK